VSGAAAARGGRTAHLTQISVFWQALACQNTLIAAHTDGHAAHSALEPVRSWLRRWEG